MQTSEPFLPFSQNLLCKHIRFDDKLDLIDKIIPLDDKTCLLIDRTHSFHLKSYSPDDEETIAKQFPLPPYAHNSNPNVLYSVDFMNLYHYLNEKRIYQVDVEDYIYHLDRDRTKYIQFVYLGDAKLAVQLGKNNPVGIIDLHESKNPPVVLHDVFGVECLISVGSCGCIAWYEKRTGFVLLYHYRTQRRKILKFSMRKIKELYSLKDHVIIAVSKQYLEILDYSKNKLIKSVGFVNNDLIPYVVVNSEGNIISYLDGKTIHVLKTEKGKIKWKNHYDLKDYSQYSKYVFINQNLIALETPNAIHILLLDSQSFSLHTVIQHPWLGFLETSGLEYQCCERACKRGFVMSINPLGNNSFGVVECVCKGQHFLHGQQRVTMFTLENLKEEDLPGHIPNVLSTTFQMRRSIILEEFRDPVRAIDVLDESFAMLITERGMIYRVNLKNYSVEDAVELSGLLQSSGVEMRKIDKFFALNGNIVAITTKVDSSPYARIMIFSLETRAVEWDSRDATSAVDDDGSIEEDFSFYDVIRLNKNQLFVSYNTRKNNVTLYKVGDITCNNSPPAEEKHSLFEYNVKNLPDGTIFEKLWSLEDSPLVAMRHGENVFNLSFIDPSQDKVRILKRFSAEKYFSVINVHMWGILDVKSVNRDVICIRIKLNTIEFVIVVYNMNTGELLNRIETEFDVIGTIRKCYRENRILYNMEKMMIFGYFGFVENGLFFESVQDLMRKKDESRNVTDVDLGVCITSRNFKRLMGRNQNALIYENDHHKNFVCILKSPNFKLECLGILKKRIGNNYHKYIYKDIVDMIFGLK